MEDPYSQALKEAYASNEDNKIILSTIEIYDSVDSPIYLVRDYEDFTATLESTAPNNASTQTTFLKSWFDVSLPESTDRLPCMELKIDNVSQILGSVIDKIIDNRRVIKVVYRELIESDFSPVPHYVLKNMELKNINVGHSISGQLYFADYSNRAFPNKYYKAVLFPGLVRG